MGEQTWLTMLKKYYLFYYVNNSMQMFFSKGTLKHITVYCYSSAAKFDGLTYLVLTFNQNYFQHKMSPNAF